MQLYLYYLYIGPSIVDSSVVSNLTECPDFFHLSLSYKVGTVCIIAHHFIITIINQGALLFER